MFITKWIIFTLLLIIIVLSPLVNAFNPVNYYFFPDIQYIVLFGSAFIILMFLLYFINPFPIKFEVNLIDIFIFSWFVYHFINFVITTNKDIYYNQRLIGNIILLVSYVIFKTYFLFERQNNRNENIFIPAVFLLSIIPIIIGVLEFSGIIPIFDDTYKMCGGFMNPGIYANYIVVLLPFSFAVFLFNNKIGIVKISAGAICIISLAMIIILNARTAWIACAISILYIIIHHNKLSTLIKSFLKPRGRKLLFIVIAFFLTISFAFALYSMKKDSADGRIFVWQRCIEMIKDKPILGSGYGSYINSYNHNQIKYFEHHPNDHKNIKLADEGVYAFNDYLQITVEQGIIGLLLFLVIIYLSFNFNNKITSSADNRLLIASRASIIAFLICGLFSYPASIASIEFVFFIFLAYNSTFNRPVFTLDINIKKIIPIAFVIISLTSIIGIKQINNYIKCTEWQKAFIDFGKKADPKTLMTYEKISPSLKHSFEFLFNYGVSLSKSGKFQESIDVMEQAKKICIIYDLFYTLGSNYENIGNYKKAEENYKNASNLIPHKLTPKYKLFKLYLRTNKKDKAYKMASLINVMEVKIYTPFAGQIKKEAIDFLRNNN